jgi:hypothetical protein
VDRACSVLGHLQGAETDIDKSILLPSLNFNDKGKIIKYLLGNGSEPVVVRIQDTDYNPWLSLGNGSAGQFMQVFFELYAFVCLLLASAKLYVYIKIQSFRANVSQACLWIEALAAVSKLIVYHLYSFEVRIFYMVGPLDFGIIYMPWSALTWFISTPNILSLLSTLLITFYWQEILSEMADQLSNKLINNLSKITDFK